MNTPRAETLTPADRAKLVVILGRLGSDFNAERATAGRMASDFLRARGLGWGDILDRPPPPAPGDWHKRAAWCAERPELLTPWERAFLAGLATRQKPPTQKQAVVLDRLVARRMAAAAGGGQ